MSVRSLMCSVLVVVSVSTAQTKRPLTLDQSITLALQQGFAAKNASAQYLASKKSYESELRKLRSSVTLSVDLPNYSQSLTSQFNPTTQLYEYYQLRSTQIQSSLSLNQPITLTGGTLSFQQMLLGRDQMSGLASGSQAERDYFGNFLVQYRQPILAPNEYRMSEERNTLSLDIARADFTRNQLEIVYNVTASFYNVYQLARRVDIARTQVNQNEESYTTAKNKFDAGLIPEVDALQTEVDLVSSKNDLLTAERGLASASNAFRLLIGLPSSEDFEAVASLVYKPVRIDQELAVKQALENRTEVLSAKQNIELRTMDIASAKAKGDFRLDLTASYGFNGTNGELNRVFNDVNTSQGAALTVTIPLFDWGSNTLQVESALYQHESAVLSLENTQQQIRQEVLDLINQLKLAESRIIVLEKSVAVAQKSYDISVERFQSGTTSRNDVAQAQQRLTNAKINSLSAIIDYQVALADLKRRTLWDYEKNEAVHPVVENEARLHD
ncbi:MAG TPA: TolC family protein [Bacteroidota bacterium]|nr:TolC family protein [Bacteroidota bacterium]